MKEIQCQPGTGTDGLSVACKAVLSIRGVDETAVLITTEQKKTTMSLSLVPLEISLVRGRKSALVAPQLRKLW